MTGPLPPPAGRSRSLIVLFAGLSLVAVAAGCFVAQALAVPTAIWTRNLLAWIVGLGGALALARSGTAGASVVLVVAALLATGATLLSEGLSGVHRWVALGPIRLNCAELFMPAFVVGLACLAPRSRWAWYAAPAAVILLALQPDGSQAVATTAAVLVLLAVLRPPLMETTVAGAGSVAAAIWAGLRPDPLEPVPEVEGILGLAWSLSPGAALVAAGALAGASLAPLVAFRSAHPEVRAAAAGLTSYFVLVALAPALAPFPVPLVGIGFSPILGSWIGVGLIASALRQMGSSIEQRPPTGGRRG